MQNAERSHFGKDIKKLVSQMTLKKRPGSVPARTSGMWRAWSVWASPVMVTDGPCGLRKQADDTDHLGLNASVTAICYPTGSCVACSFDRDLIEGSGKVLGDECQAEDVAVLLRPPVWIWKCPAPATLRR